MKRKKIKDKNPTPDLTRKQKITVMTGCIGMLLAGSAFGCGLIIEITERMDFPPIWLQKLASLCGVCIPFLLVILIVFTVIVIVLYHYGIFDTTIMR